jgi:hypothetical protein
MKYKLFKDGVLVGYMELQHLNLCCENSDMLWRYSDDGESGWDGQPRKRPQFNSVEQLF